jgi:hypothetical protein
MVSIFRAWLLSFVPKAVRSIEYAGLLGRACPAAVYEYQDAEGGQEDAAGKKFVINSQNCIHVRVPVRLNMIYRLEANCYTIRSARRVPSRLPRRTSHGVCQKAVVDPNTVSPSIGVQSRCSLELTL